MESKARKNNTKMLSHDPISFTIFTHLYYFFLHTTFLSCIPPKFHTRMIGSSSPNPPNKTT